MPGLIRLLGGLSQLGERLRSLLKVAVITRPVPDRLPFFVAQV